MTPGMGLDGSAEYVEYRRNGMAESVMGSVLNGRPVLVGMRYSGVMVF